MKTDLYCQQQRCSPMTLVSADIRGGSLERGRQTVDSWVIENMDFHGFRRYFFSTL